MYLHLTHFTETSKDPALAANPKGLGFRGLGFMGLGFRGLGFRMIWPSIRSLTQSSNRAFEARLRSSLGNCWS